MDILGEDELQDLKCKPTGRLDMSHGFLHHIRRNQIARDDYDKEVKQAKELQRRRETITPRRPRRPDIQVYHPRCGREFDALCYYAFANSTSTKDIRMLIFQMDQSQGPVLRLKSLMRASQAQRQRPMVQNSSGSTIRRTREDKPETVVGRVAEKNILDSAMRAALKARIQKEIDKRRDKR
ncbi:UPF0561 protein C2orf68 homolog isoform X1 [Pseudoliparis swirei]|uniref:UPF0561 protein C2orf68 homolog isoform X1 n=1 Tax=Pseudoliparis swirei TaxID=2059687 RepID=UPI0024BDDE35|nr:UPF0561 protein C2orf68 homolog isoform X1 [Pseudoliparis swirei]